jgi:5-methylcytosine-specific restriction protein B
MEYETVHLGSIKGGSARKHIIYWQRGAADWWLAAPLQNMAADTAWERLRAQFVKALAAGRDDRVSDLDDLDLLRHGQALAVKTVATYFPGRLLPIYSRDHLSAFIRLFGAEPNANAPAWQLNFQLIELVRQDGALADWQFDEVARFFYNHLDPREEAPKIIKIAPGPKASFWPECLRDRVIRVGWDGTDSLANYTDEAGLADHLATLYPESGPRSHESSAQWLFRFRDLPAGTQIVANSGKSEVLAVGTVTTDGYRFDPDLPEYRHIVSVDWDSSYAQHFDKPENSWQPTFQFVKPALWRQIVAGRGSGGKTPARVEPAADFALEAFDTSSNPILHRTLAVLRRKKQVILYGPPGTGKTRLALNTALALIGRGDATERLPAERNTALNALMSPPDGDPALTQLTMVTFHPSYGYEDFVEGYKPAAHSAGGLHLTLTDGLFTRVCAAAANHPESNYVLVIDEINRADLPRVLGELITVLEPDKRDHPVRLPVSGKTLTVPSNVYLVGTMNTADRSVAHLDAAIRRRFGFISLRPQPELLDSVVGALDLAILLRELNHRVRLHTDSDHEIGHAFFLRDGFPLDGESDLHSAFYDDIVPLIEDYAFDDDQLAVRILGEQLAGRADGQITQLEPEDLVAVLAKEFRASVDSDVSGV